jgi:hypothetical protein
MRTDFENIPDNARVMLYPYSDNPLYKTNHKALFSNGYFYCDLSNPAYGPDYYFGDIHVYNEGYEII